MSKTKEFSSLTASEFFKRLDLSKLDTNTANYIRQDILSFENLKLLDGTTEFDEVRAMIEENYPQALGIIPVPEKDIEEKKKTQPKQITGKVNKKEQQRIEKEEKEAAKQKHKQEVEEIEGLIELMQDTVKENPKDTDSQDYLELLQDTITELKKKKFEDGGGLGDDENDNDSKLEYIGDLIVNGYITGYDPYWYLKIDFDGEIDEADRRHIADYVVKGFTSGEIVSGEESQRGWWSIEIGDDKEIEEVESRLRYAKQFNPDKVSVYEERLKEIKNRTKKSNGGGVGDDEEMAKGGSFGNPIIAKIHKAIEEKRPKTYSELIDIVNPLVLPSYGWNANNVYFMGAYQGVRLFIYDSKNKEYQLPSKTEAYGMTEHKELPSIIVNKEGKKIKMNDGGGVGNGWKHVDEHGSYYTISNGMLLQSQSGDSDINGDEVVLVSEAAFTEDELKKFIDVIKQKTGWEYGKDYKIDLVPTKKNILPPSGKYSEYLQLASSKFGITIDEARNKYGQYTIGQWDNLLGGGVDDQKGVDKKGVVEKSQNKSGKWIFSITYADIVDGKKVWRKHPNYVSEYFDTKGDAEEGLSKRLSKKFNEGGGVGDEKEIEERLEYLRGELRAERISQGELIELQSLAKHIDPSDVELLEAAGVPEFNETEFEGKYIYKFHEERGELSAYVENMATGEEVWSFKYPDHSLPEEEREFQSTPVNDGFIRHWEDINGLEIYLKDLGILPDGAELLSEEKANKLGYYKQGGFMSRWFSRKPKEIQPSEYEVNYTRGDGSIGNPIFGSLQAAENHKADAERLGYKDVVINPIYADGGGVKKWYKKGGGIGEEITTPKGRKFTYTKRDNLHHYIWENMPKEYFSVIGKGGVSKSKLDVEALDNMADQKTKNYLEFKDEKLNNGGGIEKIEIYDNVHVPSINKSGVVINVFQENGKDRCAVEFVGEKGAKKFDCSSVEKIKNIKKTGGEVENNQLSEIKIGDVLKNKKHNFFSTVVKNEGNKVLCYYSDEKGNPKKEGSWVHVIWYWDFKEEWEKVGNIELSKAEKKYDGKLFSHYKTGDKQLDAYLSSFDVRWKFFTEYASKPLRKKHDSLENDNYHLSSAKLVADFFKNPSKKSVKDYKLSFKKGGGVWTREQEEKVNKIDTEFDQSLKEKNIDPHSREAGVHWREGGFQERFKQIFGKGDDDKKMAKGGKVSETELISKIKNIISEYGGVTIGELGEESILLEKKKKDEEWMIEGFNSDTVTVVKYVHGSEVADNKVPYEELDKKILKQIYELIKDYTGDTMAGGGSLKNKERVEVVLKHYLIAALWSSTDSDNDDTPFDRDYDTDDFDKKTVDKVRALIIKFMMDNESDLKASGLSDDQIGHDLWLTQVGHGAGFWDREGVSKEVGERLSNAAKTLGQSANLFAQKGKVHIDGLSNVDEMAKGGGVDGKTIRQLLKGYSFELILDYKKNKISLKAKDPKGKTHNVNFKADAGDTEDWWHGLEINGIELDINISINYDENDKAEYSASLYPVTIDDKGVGHTDWQDSYSIKKITVKSSPKKTLPKYEYDSDVRDFYKIDKSNSVISKDDVVIEMKKLGYSKDSAEEIIAKHIDIYEVNADDKDSTAKSIAMSIDEEENQHGDEMKRGGDVWIKDALSGGKNKGALRRTAMRKGLLRNEKEKLSKTDLHKLEKVGGKTSKRAYLAETLGKFDTGGGVSQLSKDEFANKIKDLLKQENKWHFVGETVDGKKVRMKFFVGKKEVDVQIFTIEDKGARMPRNYSGKRDTLNMIMENFSEEKFDTGGGIKDGKNGYVAFYKGKQMDVWADTSYQAQQKAASAFKAKKSYEVTVVLAEKDGEQVTHVPDFKKGGGVQKYGVYIFGSLNEDFTDELVANEYARLTKSIHPKWKVEVKPIK